MLDREKLEKLEQLVNMHDTYPTVFGASIQELIDLAKKGLHDTATSEELALESVIRLKNITMAQLRKDLWYERYNHASTMLDKSTKEYEEAKRISREGK